MISGNMKEKAIDRPETLKGLASDDPNQIVDDTESEYPNNIDIDLGQLEEDRVTPFIVKSSKSIKVLQLLLP